MKFSENLTRVFSKEGNDYEGFKQMFFDYTHGREIQDENGAVVPKQKVNEKINTVMFDILGFEVDEKPSKRDIRRAMRRNGIEVWEVIEDAIDFKVETGFQENELFNQLVEQKNIKNGDSNEFYTDSNVILSVAKVNGDHHDTTLQKLGEGQSFTVPTYDYVIKVGMDIDVYLTGRKDWSTLVDKCAEAYQVEVQNDIFAAVYSASSKLPVQSQFVVTKELTEANKARFDELLADVSTANGGVGVTIFGLATDLKKLSKLAGFGSVSWSEDQKKEVAAMGRLGSYEGTPMVEIPQRFVTNDVTKKLIPSGRLLILPNLDEKFVKFVDVGETEIREQSQKGDRKDDFMTYEVHREMGIEVILDKYHGEWNIQA